MHTQNVRLMKKNVLFIGCLLIATLGVAQNPAAFSWGKYVSPVNDQLRQGPCFTFATVGGVETMHYLFYGGYSIDLSERQVYSCAAGTGGPASIESALQYIGSTGVTTSFCIPYASGSCSQDSDNGPNSIVIQPCATLQTQLDNCTDKRRVKATYHEVTNTMKLGVEAIKTLLIGNGPIMLSLTTPALHQGATHAYLLYGYSTNNGTVTWKLRDSWPCGPTMATLTTVDLPGLFNADINTRAFVIDGITEERFISGAWQNFNLAAVPFELEAENQVVKINAPASSCYNEGLYTVSGMDKIPGATLEGWSLRYDYNYPSYGLAISSSGNLSGHAGGVTVVATIRRPNGLKEHITKYVGNVGVSFRVDKTADWCPIAGSREVHLQTRVATQPNCTYSYSMTFPSIPGGYVFNYNSSAILVSSVTQSINYTASVTIQKNGTPGCTATNTLHTYVIILPCSRFSMLADPDVNAEAPGASVFPNPAENNLSIRPGNNNPAQLRIIDPFGNIAYSANLAGPAQVDVSRMPKGIYIVELQGKGSAIERVRVILK